MSGLEARSIIETAVRRELFGPTGEGAPPGTPIDCSSGSIHFESQEASRGQFHEATTLQEILTQSDPLRRYGVGVFNWGFVLGKTQTNFPWDSWQRPYTGAPPVVWHHDIFHADGTPYRQAEVEQIRVEQFVHRVHGFVPFGRFSGSFLTTTTVRMKEGSPHLEAGQSEGYPRAYFLPGALYPGLPCLYARSGAFTSPLRNAVVTRSVRRGARRLRTVAEEPLELCLVIRGGDDGDLADAGQH